MSLSQHKWNNTLSVWSLVVGDERMRPGRWLRIVLCVLFSALTPMVGNRSTYGP